MRPIFRLGTCQPRGLDADFQFISGSRARAQRNFQILNLTLGSVDQFITNIPLMKGTVPKRLDKCLSFLTLLATF